MWQFKRGRGTHHKRLNPLRDTKPGSPPSGRRQVAPCGTRLLKTQTGARLNQRVGLSRGKTFPSKEYGHLGDFGGRPAMASELTCKVIARLLENAESFKASHREPELVPQTGVRPC